MSVATDEMERGAGTTGAPLTVPSDGPRLAYHGYRLAEALVGAVPRPVADLLAMGCADVVRLLRPHALDGLRANLAHALPGATPRRLRRIARRNVRHLARSWVDVMEFRHRPGAGAKRLRVLNLDAYRRAVAQGRGVVIVSLHFGAWEQGLATWNGMGNGMALLAEMLQPPELFERIAGARRSMGVTVIPIDVEGMRSAEPGVARRLGAGAMREVMRVLKSGGSVAIAMDRDLIGNGVPLRFFDAPAPIPLGVVEVAIRSGAVVIPIVLPRNEHGGCLGVVFEPIEYDAQRPRDEEVRRVAEQILRIFERVIRRAPEQWNVLDPIWPSPPSLAALGGAEDLEGRSR